jgi:hypothetical protein
VLGRGVEFKQDPEGEWHAVEKKGFLGRLIKDAVVRPLMLILKWALASFAVVCWYMVRS